MKRIFLSTLRLACALACVAMVACRGELNSLGYIVVSDYIEPSCGEDVSDALQQIIDDTPTEPYTSPMASTLFQSLSAPQPSLPFRWRCNSLTMPLFVLWRAGRAMRQ